VIYSLLVLSSPTSGHTNLTAVSFARTLLRRGHSIHRVFFMEAGTLTGASATVRAQDETDAGEQWRQLATEHGLDLVLCISSSLRHGMLDETEARRHDRLAATVDPAFTLSGLGQLVDAWVHSERLVTFGG
jgi:tRNA 2-thiouridine synthesizing protein D